MPDAQAIVVGGGPAGSATAALLAREGHEVLLLDRARFPRDKACAEYLSPATADALARIGALARVEAQGPARPLGMHLIMRGGSRALVRYPDGTSSRRAMCLSRRVLDATLLDYARDCGVQVLEGWQVHHVVSGPGGSTVDARPVGAPAGARRRLAASLVVGADGTRSVVARSLGLERPLPWPNRVGLVAHVRGVDGLQEYGEMYVGRGAYCGLAPLPAGLTNVGLVLDARLYRKPAGLEGAYRLALGRLPGAAARLEGARRVGPVRGVAPLARRVSRPAGDGYLLVGDAAGFLDPFTGEGVFRALRGAELAAEAASGALRRGDVTAAALAPYRAARGAEFRAKEALCVLIQGFLLWPPLLAYALRRLERRRRSVDLLGGVLGDYRPAGEALRPAFLWSLLRP
ncbi:MAG TPA: NAD(P)/FAD-dependent oxidoreductase [Chloroflexota bacterium]|nr:NAD(P)/FAD-dependent oxidoreductase [Chloroflexota bacterium]